MERLLKITIVLGLLIVIAACKPSGSSLTSTSPLPAQPQSPLATKVPPIPNPTEAALCGKYPTPPYPISLTPCPYYLTPPAQPIDLFPPQPTATLAIPNLSTESQIKTLSGKTFNLILASNNYQGPGELCDMRPSPNGLAVALYLCSGEGMSRVLIITDIAKGTAIAGGISDASGVRPYDKPTWFRGWFPDSKHVLLMSDWLEILNIETGEHQRITSESETVTDGAVSPDGQKIIYTRIQGDILEFIDTNGNLLKSIPSPSPKPGNRPENLTWSLDGKWVAYTRDQGTSYYAGPLWVINTSTSQMKQLSPSGVYDLSPRCPPDSATLLVVRRDSLTGSSADFDPTRWVSDLWTVNVGRNEWSQPAHLKGKSAWSPNWTPDGSTIVFMSALSGQPNAWSINSDGTALQQLTSDSSIAPLTLGIIPEAMP